MARLNRRTVLSNGLVLAGAAALGFRTRGAFGQAHLTRDPFTLGVASGYPTPDGVVLWSRLAPEPLAPDGGMPPAAMPVTWELARDEQFRTVVRSGTAYAEPEWAHSVHVEIAGLEPAREYWYRFRAGDARSPVGRTWTAPKSDRRLERMRINLASCQQYEHGYYTAYRQMLADHPDLIVHVGDYIYELSWGTEHVRSHGAGECYTLADYRARHALYRSDPDLQAAHAMCPWLLMWDDHEVDNDYAGAV
jgi:alkaline phosphatase D